MSNKIKKLSLINKIILASLLLLAVSNPWSIGYIGAGLDWLSTNITLYSNYGFIASLIVLGITNIYMMYASREKVNIPKKSLKTKSAGKFIED